MSAGSDKDKGSTALTPRDATVADAQHTRGPWMAAAGPSMHGWPVVNGEGRLICRLGWIDKQPDEDAADFDAFKAEVAANGRLIAAAPDLLAALLEIKRCNAQYNFGSKLLRVILPAIAKASQPPAKAGEAKQ